MSVSKMSLKTGVRDGGRDGSMKPALVFSHCQWNGLYESLNREQAEDEERKNRAELQEQRRQLSQAMAATWENTYLNMRRLRYEKRRQRLEREQKYKEERYEELRKESNELKRVICDRAKESLFCERDSTKALHSALRAAQTEAERLSQVKFHAELKAIDREIERKYAEAILEDVQRQREEAEAERREAEEKKRELKIQAKQMLSEVETMKKADKEKRESEEREDMEILMRQIQQVKENEQQEAMRKKLFERKNLLENRESVLKMKRKGKEEDEEENKAIQIIAEGKMRMTKIRKLKEMQMAEAGRARLAEMSNRLATDSAERRRREEESMKRAQEEKYKIALDKSERERQYKEMLKNERLQEHLNYMKKQEERLAVERELLKWEVLRRLQREELNNNFDQNKKREKLKKQQQFKEELIKQNTADVEKRFHERQLELEACRRSRQLWELSDLEFMEYAQSVRDEAHRKGRPVYPIDAAIYKFIKENGLESKERNFIWNAKINKKDKSLDKYEYNLLENDTAKKKEEATLQQCLTVQAICREDCGCPKKTNGLT